MRVVLCADDAKMSGPRGVPGHMAMCHSEAQPRSDCSGDCRWEVDCGKWLYIADPANHRVVRLDVTSGKDSGVVKAWKEWREGYYNYGRVVDADWEVAHDCPGKTPSGLALSPDGSRLFVSYRATGEIVALQVNHAGIMKELGRFQTPSIGVAGLAIDPVGRLFYTDVDKNQVRMVNVLCADPEAGKDSLCSAAH